MLFFNVNYAFGFLPLTHSFASTTIAGSGSPPGGVLERVMIKLTIGSLNLSIGISKVRTGLPGLMTGVNTCKGLDKDKRLY